MPLFWTSRKKAKEKHKVVPQSSAPIFIPEPLLALQEKPPFPMFDICTFSYIQWWRGYWLTTWPGPTWFWLGKDRYDSLAATLSIFMISIAPYMMSPINQWSEVLQKPEVQIFSLFPLIFITSTTISWRPHSSIHPIMGEEVPSEYDGSKITLELSPHEEVENHLWHLLWRISVCLRNRWFEWLSCDGQLMI